MNHSNETNYDDPKFQEELKQFLLELADKQQYTNSMLDGSFIIAQQRSKIDELFQLVHDRILADHTEEELGTLKHKSTRPLRSFDFELNRLFQETFEVYKEQILPSIPDFLEKAIFRGDENRKNKFLLEHFQKLTLPLLGEHDSPGDDLFLFVCFIMAFNDEKIMNTILADRLSGPAQSIEAVYGMCGLLIQADKSKKEGLGEQAYSYLIDASNMLGMYKSAAFMNARFDTVATKRFAKKQANIKHSSPSELNTAKDKVRELFVSLQKADAPDKTRLRGPWKSANEAHQEIALSMHKEIDAKVIGDSTILALCRQLHKKQKAEAKRKGRPTISVLLKHTLDDGTVVSEKVL